MRLWHFNSTALVEWVPWFAWHPVFIGNDLVWLEFVERLMSCSYIGCIYDYRRIKNDPHDNE